jgi:hypothetical protein
MMDELREMAAAPVVIFERFLGELQQITKEKSVTAPSGIERLKNLQAAMVREIEESLQRFRARMGEAEATRVSVLHPPPRNLHEDIKRAMQHLQQLLDLAARRDELLRAWEDQPSDALLEGYRAALEGHELGTVELYEAHVERVLRRGGDAAALQAFLLLRAKAQEGRRSPAQRQAKAELEEIEQFKHEVTLATQIVASTLKVSGSIAAVGAGWRKASRLRLAPEVRGRTSVLILSSPHPVMTAQLVDASRTGMGLALPEALPPGAPLSAIVKPVDGRGGELQMQGEVRWCRGPVPVPGGFLAGVCLAPGTEGNWVAMLSHLAELQRDGRAVVERCQG